MRRPEIIIFGIMACLSFSARSQSHTDSVTLLSEVVVMQSRLSDYVIGANTLPIDSTSLALASNTSVTDLLRKQGIGHMRSYGYGGLSTPSFRGTGASQTAVLWNGINLVSPLNGQLDLSLLPAGLFDNAVIRTGGSASLSGNGSIGATIHLNNDAKFNQGIRATTAFHNGSFGNQYVSGSFHSSGVRLGSVTKVFLNTSENDFKFTNRNVFPAEEQRRQHNAFDQYGILQQLYWQPTSRSILSLYLWYQDSEYEIPTPITVARDGSAVERNTSYRALLTGNYRFRNVDVNYQGAFTRHDLTYKDPLTAINSFGRFNTIVQNIEGNKKIGKKAQFTSGVNYTWEQGDVRDYGSVSPVRNRLALFSAFRYSLSPRWTFALSAREEMVDGGTTPLASTLSARYVITKSLEMFTNLSRNYRLPTFNDLFWRGSGAQGNPDLKPELSLGGEIGASLSNRLGSIKVVAFDNYIDNWILWSPVGGQTWMPQNVKKVWSRGIETQLSAERKVDQVTLGLTTVYSLTKSTNEDIYNNGNPNEIGKQLMLTPVHEGSVSLRASWKGYIIHLTTSYTGRQYTDTDNLDSNAVPSYVITSVWLIKTVPFQKLKLTFTGEINNLFDTAYEGRPGYPLPGINYKAGIQINFNNPNTK